MLTTLVVLLRSIGLICRGHRALALENLALRQQLAALKRTRTRPHLAQLIGSFGCCSPAATKPLTMPPQYRLRLHDHQGGAPLPPRGGGAPLDTDGIPEPAALSVPRSLGHELPHGHRVTATLILGGLLHEYRLEPVLRIIGWVAC